MSKKRTPKGRRWSDENPIRLRTPGVCAALDEDGFPCDEPAQFRSVYFGDDELENAGWVVVDLCQVHGRRAHQTYEANLPYKAWAKLKKAGKIRFLTR